MTFALQEKCFALLYNLCSACEDESCGDSDEARTAALSRMQQPNLAKLLDHTMVKHYYTDRARFPKYPWSMSCSLTHNELMTMVIERLLRRKRIDPNDSNILTLGYRDVAPGANGHRISHSNGVMCYYPNTLVATLKCRDWVSLHQIIGDDLLLHLLLHYSIYIPVDPNERVPRSYFQAAGKSLRWTTNMTTVATSKKRKRNPSFSVERSQPLLLCINQVMYARHFNKRRIFARSHELMYKSSDCNVLVSRQAATYVIQRMFPSIAVSSRLPKRLLSLIPIIQQLMTRFQQLDIDKMMIQLLPLPKLFLEKIRENSSISDSLSLMNRVETSIVYDNDGYLSQEEGLDERRQSKSRRIENAIEQLSAQSMTGTVRRSTKRMKMAQTTGSTNYAERRQTRQCGLEQLSHLQKHKEEITELMQMNVPPQRVYHMLRKCIGSIIPKELWGSINSTKRSNWGLVKALLKRFVFSRKYDILNLKHVTSQFQVKTIEWMNISGQSTCPPNELSKRHDLVFQLLEWTFTTLVFPILRSVFYITECEGRANEIWYYPRSVWNVISALAMYDLTAGMLRPVPKAEVALISRQLTSSRLRLLPKLKGIRPLMNLSSPAIPGSVQTSVNKSLELVHHILKYEIERQHKRLLGATVRNLDEIHGKLKPWLLELRHCDQCRTQPTVYCVTVDVERCFDTIRPQKLYQLLKKVFVEDEYLIRKHWVYKNAHFKHVRSAFPSGELIAFDEMLRQTESTGKWNDQSYQTVYVDGVLYDYMSKSNLLMLLKEHLFSNCVEMQNQTYHQQYGIPQGSVLSTTLCNLYYAHFERRIILPILTKSLHGCLHHVLMRYTDDFLFLSTNREQAMTFAQLMHDGNEDYGCFVNQMKSRVNFDLVSRDSYAQEYHIPRFDCDGDGLLAWCGLLFDPISRQIHVNYEKLSPMFLASSISMDETKSMKTSLVKKVLSVIRQRWHPLYFDMEILKLTTIRINLFEMFRVAAIRFLLILQMLPFVQHPTFFYHSILHIIKKATHGIILATLLSSSDYRRSSVTRESWMIGLHCFMTVIQSSLERQQLGLKSKSMGKLVDWLIKDMAQRQIHETDNHRQEAFDIAQLQTNCKSQIVVSDPTI